MDAYNNARVKDIGITHHRPQTPNLTSYMARMGARSRFSGRINVNVVAQQGVLEV